MKNGDDILAFTNQNGITGTFDAGTGILTLTGAAPIADYITALRSITYEKTGLNSVLTRRISFVVSDGTGDSPAFQRDIDIDASNQPPVIEEGGVPVTTINVTTDEDTPVEVCIEVVDPDGDQTEITSIISLDGMGGIDLTGPDPLCFTYTPPPAFSGTETLQVEICDLTPTALCDQVDVVITVQAVNDPPVVTGTATPLLYTDGDGAVVIDPQIGITDEDHTDLTGGSVTIANNFVSGEDILAFADQNGITGNYDAGNGILTLTGTSSVANYITALTSITYEKTSTTSNLTRQVSFVVTDGVDNSASFNRDIDIDAINQPPVIEVGGVPVTTINVLNDEDTPIEICIEATDPDGDMTVITNIVSLDGSGNTEISVIDPMCFTYTPPAEFNGVETLQVEVCDQTANSLCDQVDVIITNQPVNDLPIITGNAVPLIYANGNGAVLIDDQIGITDQDHTDLVGGSVSISNNYVMGEDVLEFNDQNGITGVFDAGTGVLTLSGTATLEHYQNALASVTYEKTGLSSTLTRLVSFVVSDGTDNSDAFSRSIDIDTSNQPPVIEEGGVSVTTISVSTNEDTPLEICIEATDPDGDMTTINSAVSLDGSGTLDLSNPDPMCLTYTPPENFNGVETVLVEVCDQTASSLCDEVNVIITVLPVNDPPTIPEVGQPPRYHPICDHGGDFPGRLY